MMLLSYTIADFHLFFDGAVDIQIWAPPTRSQFKVCDSQVTVKACGPLVWNITRCQAIYHLLPVPSLVRAWFHDSAGDTDFYQMSLSQSESTILHESIISWYTVHVWQCVLHCFELFANNELERVRTLVWDDILAFLTNINVYVY